MRPPVQEARAQELASSCWRELLTKIDCQLGDNYNPNFLVGGNLTIADVSCGAYFIKYVFSDHPHNEIYAEEMMNFPRVNQWAHNTVAPTFKGWF